ncbi:hypothetical protein B4135_0452 [Caldibacillus debilis]|uniref:Uncharacterized protein n=1 Tax=Caldibacillus debilis TaxID=301148 RepID=A0A150L947_9BACI|nr:hypothetical protein B4135_0452 [Caldibacillus debilis]
MQNQDKERKSIRSKTGDVANERRKPAPLMTRPVPAAETLNRSVEQETCINGPAAKAYL